VTFASHVRSFICSSSSDCGKVFNTVRRWIAQRFEQSCGNQNRHIGRLSVLIPPLVTALKAYRATKLNLSGKVFRYCVPKAVTLLKDLAACGIAGVDEHGRHVDFHALRNTFATMLARAGVSPRVAMELMRHNDMRLTAKTYTDAMSLPLFEELEKITPLPFSLTASLKCENLGLKAPKPVQSDLPKSEAKIILNDEARATLTNLVPPLEKMKMAERGGFEPPIRLLAV